MGCKKVHLDHWRMLIALLSTIYIGLKFQWTCFQNMWPSFITSLITGSYISQTQQLHCVTIIYHKQSIALLDNALQVSNFSNRFAGFNSGQAIQLHALLLFTCKLFGRGWTTLLLLQYCFSKPLQHIISFAIMLTALHYDSTCFVLITPKVFTSVVANVGLEKARAKFTLLGLTA